MCNLIVLEKMCNLIVLKVGDGGFHQKMVVVGVDGLFKCKKLREIVVHLSSTVRGILGVRK